MNILVIADPRLPVPPNTYGGTERIVHLLCDGLRKRDHQVTLMAGPGSQDYGNGLLVHHAPSRKLLSRIFRKILFQIIALRAARSIEVVINFGRLDYLVGLLRLRRIPLIAWFQNPVTQKEVDQLRGQRSRGLRLVGASKSQFEHIPIGDLLRIIPNAVDTDFFGCSTEPAVPPYLLFLGRLTENKGVHIAIKAAQLTGTPLKLAGNISDETGGRAYFDRCVAPNLGGQCAWVGPVDDQKKRHLLQGAAALLFPIQWPEPFGIVMIESLACGTPVIAWRNGAVSEIINQGSTGYICDSVDAVAEAIRCVLAGKIDRLACRQRAEKDYGRSRLTDNALSVIEEVVRQ